MKPHALGGEHVDGELPDCLPVKVTSHELTDRSQHIAARDQSPSVSQEEERTKIEGHLLQNEDLMIFLEPGFTTLA